MTFAHPKGQAQCDAVFEELDIAQPDNLKDLTLAAGKLA
jgi:hypothetical protein